ncbi:FGGY-family carbohydrate kinase [Candidatus Pantoea formicae]|uniref:FGGY-family carbohydrate kinase n=1 Tax=Candidatus Pantoea formicae TaxID=2608355 RepID=UPI003EDA070F
MPDNAAAIVIDIGTTNCKVACFSRQDASRLDERKFVTPKITSSSGHVDFDIDALWQQVVATMRSLIAATDCPVTHISIASFGESGVFLDSAGNILTPMLAWYDRRGEEYLADLSDADGQRLYQLTGLPLHSNYSAFKMRWLLDRYALRGRDDLRWLHAPEVLLWRLTGAQRTDTTLASRTLCLDVERGCWSAQAADILQLPLSAFAPLLNPGEVAGWVTQEWRNQLGLTQPVSVTLAGHDHMVGARALQLQAGEVLNSTGTTEGILLLQPQPLLNDQARRDKLANGRYSQPDCFTLFASLPVGGFALEWVSNTFRLSQEEIEVALQQATKRYLNQDWQPDQMPLFIPHLRGSGSPHKNRHTRGLLYGLIDTLPHDELLLTVLLGLTMEFANCFTCFAVPAGHALKVIGPATRNPLWLQLKADSLARTVEAIAFDEAVSVGALLIACDDVPPPEVCVAQRYQPDDERGRALQCYQQRWQAFYQFKLQHEGVISPHSSGEA